MFEHKPSLSGLAGDDTYALDWLRASAGNGMIAFLKTNFGVWCYEWMWTEFEEADGLFKGAMDKSVLSINTNFGLL